MVWLLHQTLLVASETLSGLMVYCSWAEASDSNAADARAVAVNVFIMPDYWRCAVWCMLMAVLVNTRLVSRNVSVCPMVEARRISNGCGAGMPTAQWGRFTVDFD